jgi:hypothetical protein
MIELILPYAPSVNNYKRIGRLRTLKSGAVYQTRVNTEATTRFYWKVWIITRARQLKSLGDALIDLEVDVYAPDNRRRDL